MSEKVAKSKNSFAGASGALGTYKVYTTNLSRGNPDCRVSATTFDEVVVMKSREDPCAPGKNLPSHLVRDPLPILVENCLYEHE